MVPVGSRWVWEGVFFVGGFSGMGVFWVRFGSILEGFFGEGELFQVCSTLVLQTPLKTHCIGAADFTLKCRAFCFIGKPRIGDKFPKRGEIC